MRVVIQRVSEASVSINGAVHGQTGKGLVLLVGIETADGNEDVNWLANKIVSMRIFSDDAGLMNHSLLDIKGELLVISQFTLHAKTKKGNRPSYICAARPEIAIPLYDSFILKLQELIGDKVSSGVFGADMKVSLVNDGPVTILLDSRAKS